MAEFKVNPAVKKGRRLGGKKTFTQNKVSKAVQLRLHPKQFEVYRDRHRFKVVVAGRRWGKCLASDTLISMADGTQKRIQDVKAGDVVLTVNEDTYALEPNVVQHVQSNGVKECIRVKTSSREIEATPNHPFLANNTWINAGELKKGDLVAVPKQTIFGDKVCDSLDLEVLSIWLAEGSGYTITNQSPEIVNLIRRYAKVNGLSFNESEKLNHHMFNGDRAGGPQSGTKNPLRAMLEDWGVWGLNSKTKFIPDFVFELNSDLIALFLNRFVACDGSISKRGKHTYCVEIGLANEYMIKQLAELLKKFGIASTFSHKIHKATSTVTGKCFESWVLRISDRESLIKFCENIGAVGKEKAVTLALEAAKKSAGNKNRYLPISYKQLTEHLDYTLEERGRFGGYNAKHERGLPNELRLNLNSWRKQSTERISEQRYKSLRGFTDGYFDPIADGDVEWEEITSVSETETQQTWDLMIENNHNFIANGFVTHNTKLAAAWLIAGAAKSQSVNWYIAPSYQMAKQIIWQDLKNSVNPSQIKRIYDSDLRIVFRNGAVIQCKGADNPDSLRGVALDRVCMDEFQDIQVEAWQEAIRPTLSSTGGIALIIGTPKSFNHLHALYAKGQSDNPDDAEWASWQFPTISSPFIPEAEIESAKRDMDAKSFRQEFLASFEGMTGRVYHAFERDIHVDNLPFNPELPIWIGQDFNVDPMTSCVMQPQPNGEVWIVDELYLPNSNVEEVCRELERRYWQHQKDIQIYPDPSGQQRQQGRGDTNFDIFRDAGFSSVISRNRTPPIQDRVNSVNSMLMAADGTVRLRVDKKCVHTIKSLEQTMYKEGTPDIDKRQGNEHMTDALGYCIEYRFPLKKIKLLGFNYD